MPQSLQVLLLKIIGFYPCQSVCIRGSKEFELPHERQLRGARAAGGLEIRDRIARIEARAGPAILHARGMARRRNGLNAPGRYGVLRGCIGGVRANAKIHQRGILDGHAHAIDGRDNRGPRYGVHRKLLLHVIGI
jgi:hypothetical protein